MTLSGPHRRKEMGKIFLSIFIVSTITWAIFKSLPAASLFNDRKVSGWKSNTPVIRQASQISRWRINFQQTPEIVINSSDETIQTPAQIEHREEKTARTETHRIPYFPHIKKAAERAGLNPHLVSAVIKAESNFDPQVVSPSGAVGLMQLMPETASKMGITNLYDPHENIQAGTRYLSYCIDKFRDTRLALAAYNAGPAVVARQNQVPDNGQTLNFIRKVMHYKATFESTGMRPDTSFTIQMAPLVTIEDGARTASAADILVLAESMG